MLSINIKENKLMLFRKKEKKKDNELTIVMEKSQYKNSLHS